MRRLTAITAALLLSCGVAAVQAASSSSGIGMTSPSIAGTSPLGIPGSSTPTMPNGSFPTGLTGVGIGLGATELNPGGLSPAVSRNCSSASSGMASGITGMSNSTFDGGGTTGMGRVPLPQECTTASTGTSSTGSESSSPALPFLSRGGIALGATEINNAGVNAWPHSQHLPRPARTLRLRVQAQWNRQSVRLPRRASALVQGQGDRAASSRRLCPMHA
jgi:hypothetical protein